MPELDTVRGVAVLGVLLVHGFVFSYGVNFHGYLGLFMQATALGKLGVNLFFVLSGFLITGILFNQRNAERYYAPFYWKRVCRIFPAYFLTISLVLITTHAWQFTLISSFFLANVSELFGVVSPYGPLWSLAVEEHFYLVWPTIVRRLPKTTVVAVALALILSAPLLRFEQVVFKWPAHLATWFNWDGLAAGALLRVAMVRFSSRRVWMVVAPGLCVLALMGILMLAAFHQVNEATPVGNALQISFWSLLFAGFVAFMLLLGTSRFAKFATPRFLVFLGYVSYGLYLYHLMIYMAFDHLFPHCNMFVRFGIVAPCAVGVAWISRATVEEYFLSKKDTVGGERQLLATPTIAGAD